MDLHLEIAKMQSDVKSSGIPSQTQAAKEEERERNNHNHMRFAPRLEGGELENAIIIVIMPEECLLPSL